MKTVLYLIQARDKLPSIYNCLRKRNFLLLSYKTETPDTTIFAPNTTWTEGRNLLYEYVKKHKFIYDYYVFMDEDVVLFPTSQTVKYPLSLIRNLCSSLIYKCIPKSQSYKIQESGYRSLEAVFEFNFPIVTLLFWPIVTKKMYHKYISEQLPEGYRISALGKTTWSLQTLPIFDAILVAVSRDAFFAKTVLPYTTTYDNITWHLSQYIFYLKANHYYYNRIIQNNCYFVANTSTSPYPRVTQAKQFEVDLYKNLCKEFGVDAIQASECRKIPAQDIQINLNNKKYPAISFLIDLLSVCMFPIVVMQKVGRSIRKLIGNV